MPPLNRLNPSAGDVPMPDDPREIDAALRAGRITWRLVPYYRWRYGERGEAFTRSDSAWLVTLCRHPQSHVHEQLAWLGAVLSNRGMPQWLLEIHLEVLFRQLNRTVPENATAYEKLLTASFVLSEARQRRISEESVERLSKQFARDVGAPGHRWMLGTGRLLVAAVADEKAGMTHAVTSLESWLVDPKRFDEARGHAFPPNLSDIAERLPPERWRRAVHQIIEHARG